MLHNGSVEDSDSLYISINEINVILLTMPKHTENPRLIYQLVKVDCGYEISGSGEGEEVMFSKSSLNLLLNTPCGLKSMVKRSSSLTDNTKFRIPLKRNDKYWEIDNK